MEVLFLLVIVASNIACFIIGARVGQKVSKGETIETPLPNPLKAVREHNDKKQAEREQERIKAIMENIENYDGTGQGQKDIPRG